METSTETRPTTSSPGRVALPSRRSHCSATVGEPTTRVHHLKRLPTPACLLHKGRPGPRRAVTCSTRTCSLRATALWTAPPSSSGVCSTPAAAILAAIASVCARPWQLMPTSVPSEVSPSSGAAMTSAVSFFGSFLSNQHFRIVMLNFLASHP